MRLLDRLITGKKQTLTGYTDQAEFVFILGMHRSGTSCLAGSLERCGLFLGDVSRHNPYNAKGNHESQKVRQVHDQILCTSGGSWYQPPPRITVNWHQRWALKAIAAQLVRHRPCGLKDPRLLLVLDTWMVIVDLYTLVGTFRHPAAVARSLAKRDQISAEEAYSLWLEYNTELVRWHKTYRFPIVEFDLSDAEAYCRTIAAAAIALGLKPDMARLREFISPDMDHASPSNEPVPAVCQEVYAYLQYHRCQPASLN